MLLFSCYFLAVSKSFVNAEQFDILQISNVPFPKSSYGTGEGQDKNVVSINGSYKEPIHDYTICYRFLVEFYNDKIFLIFSAYKDSSIEHIHILDRFGGMGTGYESEGLQGGLFINKRNVSKGKFNGKSLPYYHNFVFPKDLDISKWYHNCVSYSNSLNHVHFYTDGLKAFSFNYHDESEPLPANAFEFTRMGHNFRGLITDLQVHSQYFDKKEMIHTTTTCDGKMGDIISWNKNNVKIIKEFDIFMRNFAKVYSNSNFEIKLG